MKKVIIAPRRAIKTVDKKILNMSGYLVIESKDPSKVVLLSENKNETDSSVNLDRTELYILILMCKKLLNYQKQSQILNQLLSKLNVAYEN